MKITILDPAMCCSNGVCGSDIDDALVETAAHVKWLKSLGVEVSRLNISNDAEAFKSYPEAMKKLKNEGMNSLPYVLMNGQILISGRYPDKQEWQSLLTQFQEKTNQASEISSDTEFTEKKVETLIAIGSAMAASCPNCLDRHTEDAKSLGIDLQHIVMAMNVGNKAKATASQNIIQQANSLIKEMQPAGSGNCSGSGCC